MSVKERAFNPAPCPICKRDGSLKYTPFCSKRCADLDLHRWLGGSYAVPGEATGDDTEKDFDA